MNNENRAQQADAAAAENSGKMFTQDEVNRIVSERLARERTKAEPSAADLREQDLKAREALLACRDYLDENQLSKKFLDVFDHSDPAAFKKKVEQLQELHSELFPVKLIGAKPGQAGPRSPFSHDPIADAFKPKT